MASQGMALAMLQRPVEALKTVEGAPADCMFCQGARGIALSRLGDAAGSDRAFAEMVRLAPTNMTGFIFWGRERLLRGDAQGALAIFRRVQTKAPRFADGWSWAGDALLATADANAAETAFAKGAPFAPRWGRLYLKWGEALAAQGKADEARAKWRTAAGMDLTAAERARLQILAGKQTG
jgi:tetratricopeptide (TPR) repeat protein